MVYIAMEFSFPCWRYFPCNSLYTRVRRAFTVTYEQMLYERWDTVRRRGIRSNQDSSQGLSDPLVWLQTFVHRLHGELSEGLPKLEEDLNQMVSILHPGFRVELVHVEGPSTEGKTSENCPI